MNNRLKQLVIAASASLALVSVGVQANDRSHRGCDHGNAVQHHEHHHYYQQSSPAPAPSHYRGGHYGGGHYAPAPQAVYQAYPQPTYGAAYGHGYAPRSYHQPRYQQPSYQRGYAGNQPNFGSAVGGALGGLVGSKVGKGSGKLAATAAGTVAGFLLGGHVGDAYRY